MEGLGAWLTRRAQLRDHLKRQLHHDPARGLDGIVRACRDAQVLLPSRRSLGLYLFGRNADRLLQFSPPSFISLDDWVFNTEAHPFRVPKPSSQQGTKTYLWTGPDDTALPPPSFDSNVGQGTPVQLWARVQQAATLNAIKNKAASRKTQPAPETRPKFVRPPEAQLQEVRVRGILASVVVSVADDAVVPRRHSLRTRQPSSLPRSSLRPQLLATARRISSRW